MHRKLILSLLALVVVALSAGGYLLLRPEPKPQQELTASKDPKTQSEEARLLANVLIIAQDEFENRNGGFSNDLPTLLTYLPERYSYGNVLVSRHLVELNADQKRFRVTVWSRPRKTGNYFRHYFDGNKSLKTCSGEFGGCTQNRW